MKTVQELSIVLPIFNERNNLEPLIGEIIAVVPTLVQRWEIIAVNDGSMDGSAEILSMLQERYAGLQVVKHQINRGYGAALRAGFFAAQYEHIFFMDADGQFRINAIRQFLPCAGPETLIIGFRSDRKDGGFRKLNGTLWSLLIGLLFRFHVRDLDCAYKLFPRALLHDVSLYAQGAFINAELLYWAKKRNYRIVELPVMHYPRLVGQQSGANPRVIYKAFSELLSFFWREQ